MNKDEKLKIEIDREKVLWQRYEVRFFAYAVLFMTLCVYLFNGTAGFFLIIVGIAIFITLYKMIISGNKLFGFYEKLLGESK